MLPKIEQPYFTTKLPISGLDVRYRPYLMKEQKIILIALSSDNAVDISMAVDQVLTNCTDGLVDVNKLNAVDIGFLMVKVRSSAEGGIVDINMHCKNIVTVKDEETGKETNKECGHLTPMDVDLNTMEIKGEVDESLSKVDLGQGIGIQLKIPSLDMFNLVGKSDEDFITALPMLIDFVYDADGSVFKLDNEPEEQVEEFFEQLSSKNIDDIVKFFKSMPSIIVKVPFTCEKCGYSEEVEVEDIQSFLG